MHPDLANLLGSLRVDPDDEVAYQALADWCLEQPDAATHARAEHIRLSRILPQTSGLSIERKQIANRVKALQKKHRSVWLGSMRDFAHHYDFLPGGLVKLEVTGNRLQQALAAKVGPPTEQDFAWVTNLIARVIEPPELAWFAEHLPEGIVRSFTLRASESLGRKLGSVFVNCRWLSGLRVLEISPYSAQLTDVGVTGLFELPHIGPLSEIRLRNVQLGVEECSSLARLTRFGQLAHLDLPQCGLNSISARSLFAPAFAPPLTTLALRTNALTADTLECLADWPSLATVRTLKLCTNPVGDDGVIALARSPYLGELRELTISGCGLTNRALLALAAAPMPKLEKLDVMENPGIDDTGLMAICESATLQHLREFRRFSRDVRLQKQTSAALAKRFPF